MHGDDRDGDHAVSVGGSVVDLREAETGELTFGSTPTAELRLGAVPAHLEVGAMVADRYRVTRYLGRGGFSTVFEADDRTSGDRVALKLMSSRATDRSLRARMERELRLARDLRHPNIVRVEELLELGDYHCLVMELVPGETLKQRVARTGPLPFDHVGAMLEGLSSALAAVHAGGVVHRDLKPQNAIVTPEQVVKLLDFGLAKTPDSTGLTATGTILGTPDYMAPEQVDGATADERSDLYSLGVIGYELLAGHPPFTGDSPLAVALQHVRSRVPDVSLERPDTPPRLARLIARLTEPKPAARPESAAAVLAELEALRHDPFGGLAEPSRRRRPRLAAAAVALALVGSGGAWWALRQGSPSAAVDPFADGVVHVAVSTRPALGVVGGDLFLEALGDALTRRLTPPTFVATDAGDNDRSALGRAGVEQLLELALEPEVRDDGRRSYRLVATVRDLARDQPWRELTAVALPGLDFEGVDVASAHLVEGYQRAIDAELASRQAAARPGGNEPGQRQGAGTGVGGSGSNQ